MIFMDFEELLSPFTLTDFSYSETALRCGIDNGLDPRSIPQHVEITYNLSQLVEKILRPVSIEFSVLPLITSAFRCEELNRTVGGVSASQHLKGQAVDFIMPDCELLLVAEWIRKSLSYDQLLIERGNGQEWIHVSYVSEEDNRNQVKWFDGSAWHKGLPLREDL